MKNSGFTLPELLITMSIFIALTAIATIALANIKSKASLNATVTTLIADLKQSQLKSMAGDTEGRPVPDSYGIYLQSTSYTIFHKAYNPADASNFTVNLGDNIRISNQPITLIFASGSGELVSPTSIILQDNQTNAQKTLLLNQLGVISAVN